MNGDTTGASRVFTDWIGLAGAAAAGVVLVVIVLFIRRRLQRDLGAAEIVFGLLPVAVWLLVGGHVSRLAFAGVEFEAGRAILAASREPVEGQVASIDQVVDEIRPEHRDEKAAAAEIPRLVEKRVQALEFRLGRGGYYVGSVVKRYFDALAPHPFFRYVLIFDGRGGLFGMFADDALVTHLASRNDGYQWFAKALNRSDESAREELRAIPGFVSGALAITPRTSKREALQSMEQNGIAFLPAVRPDRGFVGVVDRDRLTASLILDVTSALDETR